ncbi:GAF domain-containing protein [Telluribacter sp. SYSU D00476]|uniref:GAF domain-containing protein n=1 Tax=Telluribacter sp. SYSU D00476 TaxID=2811430 RepID=UPI001FF58876|nr:GAF domain-containing protein [Telluribacter sp. SYSU D00476]
MLKTLPVPVNEPQRLKALKNYKILTTVAEPEFDRLTHLASVICKVPICLITLVDREKVWFKSRQGLDLDHIDRHQFFCHYTIGSGTLFEVEDASEDDRFKSTPLVAGSSAIRFYAGYPIVDPQGNALGTFCILDHKANKLSEEQELTLRTLAQEVASHIVSKKEQRTLKLYEALITTAVNGANGETVEDCCTDWSELTTIAQAPKELYLKITQFIHMANAAPKPGVEVDTEANVIDLAYLKNFSDGSSEFEKEMIELYLSRTPEDMGNLEIAIQEGDYDLIMKRAHKLSSSFALMGVKEQGLLKYMEEQAASHDDLAAIRSSFDKLMRIFLLSVELLRKELEK